MTVTAFSYGPFHIRVVRSQFGGDRFPAHLVIGEQFLLLDYFTHPMIKQFVGIEFLFLSLLDFLLLFLYFFAGSLSFWYTTRTMSMIMTHMTTMEAIRIFLILRRSNFIWSTP